MRAESHPARRILIRASALLASALLTACTLAPPPGRSITIQLPRTNGPGSGTITGAWQKPGPSSLNDQGPSAVSFDSFNCFAINVTASDIPADPGNQCASTSVGIIAGLVPSSAGSITIAVPDGAARTFQLIGVPSSVGCPAIAPILANPGPSTTQGLGNPYLLGQTTSDVSGNTSISIDASFVAGVTPRVFQCGGNNNNGGGNQYGPVAALGAQNDHISQYGAPGLFDFPMQLAPASALDGSEFSAMAPTALDPAQAGAYQNVTTAGTLPLVATGSGIDMVVPSSQSGYRSVIQLQWDATGWDLNTYPFGTFSLEIAGGTEEYSNPLCLAPGGTSNSGSDIPMVTASVYDFARAQWIPIGQGGSPSAAGLYWQGTGQGYAPVQTAELLTTNAAGHKVMVVNVESNYLNLASKPCSSSVHVAGAQFMLMSSQQQQQNQSTVTSVPGTSSGGGDGEGDDEGGRLLGVEPIGTVLPNSNGGCSPSLQCEGTAPGGSFGLSIYGGTAPYAFALTGMGTIDPVTGYYTASSIKGANTDTIMVTDATGQYTAGISVSSVTGVTGFNVRSPGLAGPITAGADCLPLVVSTAGFGWGSPLNAEAQNFFFTFPNLTAPNYFSDSSCSVSQGSTPPQIAPDASSESIWVVLNTAANFMMYAQGSGAQNGLGFQLTVNPSAPYMVAATWPLSDMGNGSYQADPGVCTPMAYSVQDSYGNTIRGAAVSDTVFVAGAFTTWADVNCTATLPGGAPITSGTPFQAYVKWMSTGVNQGIQATLTNQLGTGPYFTDATVDVETSTGPENLSVFFPDSSAELQGGCVELDVEVVNGNNALTPDASTHIVVFDSDSAIGALAQFADPGCTQALATSIAIPSNVSGSITGLAGPGFYRTWVQIPVGAHGSSFVEASEVGCGGGCLGSSNVNF